MSSRASDRKSAAVFLAPFMAMFTLFFIVPIGYALYQSLLRVERTGPLGMGGTRNVFAGLANYQAALTDPAFIQSIGRVLLFGLVQVPLMIGLATLLALLLDSVSARA